MPRTPAHSPSFLDVRGSRTGRQHSDDGSGSDTVEDQLGLNHARAASRRASEAIIAADDDTQRELWDAMADDVTDKHAALRREREPLAARVRALQAEADAMEVQGYATTSKQEALALRKKNHVELSPEFEALAAVDARIDAANNEYSEWASRLIKRRPSSMSDAASDRLKSVLARIAAQQAEDDRRDAAIEFQKRNKESRAALKIPVGSSRKGGGCWSHPVEPAVSLPAEGVIEVQCLRCKKAWRRRFGEIYVWAGDCQAGVNLMCPNKLCSGNGNVHRDWGTRFRDAEGKACSFE